MTTDFSSLSILLVEPSTPQSKVIIKKLSANGVINIDTASSGEEALAYLEKYPADLMISAMYLPDMTADHLFRKVRQNDRLADVNYMLVSSERKLTALDPIKQSGAIAILPKPFDREELTQALKTTIDYLEPDEIVLDSEDIAEMNILVVDDSFTSRQHLRRVLEALGATDIIIAENGIEAIKHLEQDVFSLIITDLNMPEMNGQQLVEYIREEQKDLNTPILMVTSEADEARLASVHQSGISAICDKPFAIDEVKELLYRILV
ncbi:MAG TPA: two-component system response regulator [Gammaproteobacteria bacterium]|nr:two-component system response regulator [Gammaproteobacteria bacterium]